MSGGLLRPKKAGTAVYEGSSRSLRASDKRAKKEGFLVGPNIRFFAGFVHRERRSFTELFPLKSRSGAPYSATGFYALELRHNGVFANPVEMSSNHASEAE